MRILLLLLFAPMALMAQKTVTVTMPSALYGNERELLVYLPKEYDAEPGRRFEVIYVFDAQNRQYFDQVHATLNFVNNWQFPMIVIGIVSQERNKEMLTPNNHPETAEMYGGHLGEAAKFLDHVTGELMPFIDKTYRTLPTRIGIGHSNSGTFLSYCLLQKPEAFDALLAISPNYGYDRLQFVERFKGFDAARITSPKYFYTCHADEAGDWITGREQVTALLEGGKLGNKVTLSNRGFTAENHETVFPIGLFYGLRGYFEHQFFNAASLVAYYKRLDASGAYTLSSEQVNSLAYGFLWSGKAAGAITVMAWGLERYPGDHNLYDSMGEFREKSGDKTSAALYYRQAMQVLEKQKGNLDRKTFDEKYKSYKGNYERVK